MPDSLFPLNWDQAFEHAVTQLQFPCPEERRDRITEYLDRFAQMVGVSALCL